MRRHKPFALERFLTRLAARTWYAFAFALWLCGWILLAPWWTLYIIFRLDEPRQRQAALDCLQLLLGGLWGLVHGTALVGLVVGDAATVAVGLVLSWLWTRGQRQDVLAVDTDGVPIARVA